MTVLGKRDDFAFKHATKLTILADILFEFYQLEIIKPKVSHIIKRHQNANDR